MPRTILLFFAALALTAIAPHTASAGQTPAQRPSGHPHHAAALAPDTASPGNLAILHSFDDASVSNVVDDGEAPEAALIQGGDGNFYGTARFGGSTTNAQDGGGTVFKVTPAGAVTVLHNFDDGSVANDGESPRAALVQGSDGNFYGTTYYGGSAGYGTVFKITPTGTLTVLDSFTALEGKGTNSDGAEPQAALIQGTDGNFYGTTEQGGAGGGGTVFKITPAGTLTLLHSFGDGSVTNDGLLPDAALVQGTDGNFYGTTEQGGSSKEGTVFKITPSEAYTVIHNFNDGSVTNDGQNPVAALIQGSDGNFYGTTEQGGSSKEGTVFKITPSGGTVTTLHSFDDGSVTNDGALPQTALVRGSDGNFYGTTLYGGSTVAADPNGHGYGTAFKITPAGIETVLHSFADGSVTNDGVNPQAALVQGSGGNFYGTTYEGGFTDNGSTVGLGTVFEMTSAGTVTILHDFGEENDGINPVAALIQGTDGNFYGTTPSGGSASEGTVFQITPAGTVTVLHSFNDGSITNDGEFPEAALIQGTDGNFYGTTLYGGSTASSQYSGAGTVFRITPSGAVTILHNFADGSVINDGVNPRAALVQGSDGNFYGTTYEGGSTVNSQDGAGTVFQITPAGTVTILHSFNDGSVTNDGEFPEAALILGTDGNFYGTTLYGGSTVAADPSGNGYGTVFRITPENTVTILHSFNDGSVTNDGEFPEAALVQGGNGNFYGTTPSGGSASKGTVFQITSGNAVTIHSFGDGSITNDGAFPLAGLIQGSDGNFYGTTANGGSTASNQNSGEGTVFQITSGGTVTILHNFGDGSVVYDDGLVPMDALVQGTDGGFYGTTDRGGSAGDGTVFRLSLIPAITSISPTTGPVGSMVVIMGVNLTGTSTVRFHNANAKTFTVNTAGTQITVTVPTGAGTGTITVTTPGGVVKSVQTFTVTVPPTVTSFTPASGPVGTVVTVTGTHLNGVTSVRFHNANATTFSANAAGTQLTVTVPTGAGTGTFTVTTPAGSIKTTGTFTVTVPPTITSISPTSGPVGTIVTVTGTNFTGTTTVRFHNANAKTFSVNGAGTQITVTVPSGAGTGTITVTTPAGVVKSAQTFTVT